MGKITVNANTHFIGVEPSIHEQLLGMSDDCLMIQNHQLQLGLNFAFGGVLTFLLMGLPAFLLIIIVPWLPPYGYRDGIQIISFFEKISGMPFSAIMVYILQDKSDLNGIPYNDLKQRLSTCKKITNLDIFNEELYRRPAVPPSSRSRLQGIILSILGIIIIPLVGLGYAHSERVFSPYYKTLSAFPTLNYLLGNSYLMREDALKNNDIEAWRHFLLMQTVTLQDRGDEINYLLEYGNSESLKILMAERPFDLSEHLAAPDPLDSLLILNEAPLPMYKAIYRYLTPEQQRSYNENVMRHQLKMLGFDRDASNIMIHPRHTSVAESSILFFNRPDVLREFLNNWQPAKDQPDLKILWQLASIHQQQNILNVLREYGITGNGE